MNKAIVYMRVSSQDQVGNYSFAVQKLSCQDYAKKNGYDVVRIFQEEGESAKTADRPKLGLSPTRHKYEKMHEEKSTGENPCKKNKNRPSE